VRPFRDMRRPQAFVSHAGESPVMMQATVTLAQNQILEPDASRFQNPFNTPMWIDEIRFRASLGAAGGGFRPPLLSIRASLQMGRAFLTNGYIPIGNFGKVLTNDPRDVSSFATINSYENENSFHCFKLAHPLFVPPNELLVPKFQYEGKYGDLGSIDVDVIYAGRSLPANFPTPKEQWHPWIAAFDTPPLAMTQGQSDSTLSTEAQLVNPFDEDLYIRHFIGRSAVILSGPAISTIAELCGTDVAPTTSASNFFRDTTVRATDSFGNILVRDATPFTHLFHYSDRAWTVNSKLPTKGFYIFQIDRNYNTTQASATGAVAVSMVGYRKVKVSP